MPLATIRPMGESGLYHIHFLDASAGHPDQGLPGGPGHAGNRLPWAPGHPDQGLPGQPGHPGQGLPPVHGHPDQGLPGSGLPDNTLPSTPPPTLMPGWTLAMVRTPDGKWHYASLAPSSPPPRPLPGRP